MERKDLPQQEPSDPILDQFLKGEVDLDTCRQKCQELYPDPIVAEAKFRHIRLDLAINQYISEANYPDFQKTCEEIYPDAGNLDDGLGRRNAIKELRESVVCMLLHDNDYSFDQYQKYMHPIPPSFNLRELAKSIASEE
jgi:hypothetical protein